MQVAEQCTARNEVSNPAGIGWDRDDYSATSVIGPEGGMVRVTDTNSPIFGTCLRVPPGALDTPVRISILSGDHACSFGLSPSIKLLPGGLRFKRFATLKVCLNDAGTASLKDDRGDEPGLFQYDETTDRWAHDEAVRLDREGNSVTCCLLHL